MTEIDNFLAHYGVKGMRWGRRKAKDTSFQDARREIMRGKTLDERVNRARQEKKLKKLLRDDLSPRRAAAKDFTKKLLDEHKSEIVAGLVTGATTAAGIAFMKYNLSRSFSEISISPIPLR